MTDGVCLGYAVQSAFPVRFLRPGTAGMPLRVREWDPPADPSSGGELLVRWRPRPDRPFHGEVHRVAGSLVVNTSDAGWFRIDENSGTVEAPRVGDSVAREVRLWTTPMLLLATLAGRVPLHAASVDIGGKVVALAAPGGFGKTTLVTALVAHGHRLMAEDITIVDEPDRMVLAGPDLLRLRPPTPEHIALPPSWETVASTPDRYFVRTGTRDSSPAPLAAIVFVKTGTRIELVERSDARRLADLWQVGFHLPNMADRTRSFDAIASLADSVPIYDLGRPMEWSVLGETVSIIEELVS